MGTHPIFESDFDCLTETGYKMTKGTTSRGTRNDKTHIISRISGRRVYHLQKKHDSVRGRFNWSKKAGKKAPVTQAEAMAELRDVIESIKPDDFTPTVIKQTDDYLYAEFQSPIFGFIDDVEFFFPGGKRDLVEYRSASRIGESDGDANRKRIKAIRVALQKKGWKSIGF